MLDDIRKSQEQPIELTPRQVLFMQLDAIGEPIIRQWLMHKELERQERSKSVEEVVNTKPTYEILKEEGSNEREADYHEPN